jgi:hypothetical protein
MNATKAFIARSPGCSTNGNDSFLVEIEDSVIGIAPLTDDRIAVAASRGADYLETALLKSAASVEVESVVFCPFAKQSPKWPGLSP